MMSEFQSIPNSSSTYEQQISINQQKGPQPGQESAAVQAGQTLERAKPGSGKKSSSVPQSTKTKLKFQVDQESNDVTVLILDARSHEVIRTVPPEELSELTPGELINLSR
jgi:uncharacterized FlaG/YvyC family protein